MKVGVFVDEGDVVLVQFTSFFAVLLGWHLVVCTSTITVSHTNRPHDIDNKLGESTRLTTYPLSCFNFSRIVEYDEGENVGSAFISAKKTAIAWNKKSSTQIHLSLLSQDCRKRLLTEFWISMPWLICTIFKRNKNKLKQTLHFVVLLSVTLLSVTLLSHFCLLRPLWKWLSVAFKRWFRDVF